MKSGKKKTRAPEENKPEEEAVKPSGVKQRGFASMTADRVRELGRQGGRAAHEVGKAHEFSSEEASLAGIKGGRSRRLPAIAVMKSAYRKVQKKRSDEEEAS